MGYLRRHPLIAACVAVAAILLVLLGFETGWGTHLRPELPKPSGKPAAMVDSRVLPPVVLGSADQAFPETASRPLFVPTRRPVPVAATAGASAMPKGSLTLQGVIVASGIRTALLREKSNGRIHRVQQGREVNGMTVAQIEPDRVVLRQGDDQEMVVMAVQKGSGTPAANPAAAQGPFAGASPAMPSPGSPSTLPATGIQGFGGPTGSPAATAHPEGATASHGATPATPNAPVQPNAGPMTPEELLARRRARRNPQ